MPIQNTRLCPHTQCQYRTQNCAHIHNANTEYKIVPTYTMPIQNTKLCPHTQCQYRTQDCAHIHNANTEHEIVPTYTVPIQNTKLCTHTQCQYRIQDCAHIHNANTEHKTVPTYTMLIQNTKLCPHTQCQYRTHTHGSMHAHPHLHTHTHTHMHARMYQKIPKRWQWQQVHPNGDSGNRYHRQQLLQEIGGVGVSTGDSVCLVLLLAEKIVPGYTKGCFCFRYPGQQVKPETGGVGG